MVGALIVGHLSRRNHHSPAPQGPAIRRRIHQSAREDEDEPRVLLIILRHLAQARGIARVAKAAGVERESLYRALSARVAVTKAIGLALGSSVSLRPQRPLSARPSSAQLACIPTGCSVLPHPVRTPPA